MITIAIDRPRKNALGTETMRWLLEAIEAAGEAPILLTGSGDAFSAGLDLKEVASVDRAGMVGYLDLLDRLMTRLFTHPAPTVAAINGHAIAGGCVLVLCCDHRIAGADPKIRIGLNEVALGLPFPPRILEIARRRVPPHHLEEVVLEAGLHAPERALHLGLVDALADDPVQAAGAWLTRVAALPRLAYAATKAAVRGDLHLAPAEVERFDDAYLAIWLSEDVRARVRARLAPKG